MAAVAVCGVSVVAAAVVMVMTSWDGPALVVVAVAIGVAATSFLDGRLRVVSARAIEHVETAMPAQECGTRPERPTIALSVSDALNARDRNRIGPAAGRPSGLGIFREGRGFDRENVVVLVTRYFIGIRDENNIDVKSWIDQRSELFFSYTLPSVMNQTRRPDLWVLLVSDWCREDVAGLQEMVLRHGARFASVEYVDGRGLFTGSLDASGPEPVAYVDGRVEGATDGVWNARRFQWCDVVEKKVSEIRGKSRSVQNLIVSRLDNDDALAHDYFDAVQVYARHRRPLTAPVLVSFPYGMQMCRDDKRLVVSMATNGHCTSMVSPIDSPCFDVYEGHAQVFREDRLDQMPVDLLMTMRPMWMEIVHGGNLVNRVRPYEEITLRSAELRTRFGFGA